MDSKHFLAPDIRRKRRKLEEEATRQHALALPRKRLTLQGPGSIKGCPFVVTPASRRSSAHPTLGYFETLTSPLEGESR